MGGVQILKPGHQSKVVNTLFDWSIITGQSCSLNFQGNNQGNVNLLDQIVMVYINNVDNIRDCTVYFPDSGMFVSAYGSIWENTR